MSNRHYLLQVLGLSAIPRIVTFSLTLLSLPLMIRAVGAEQYGIFVYLQSFAAIFELLAGCGVASAAGRGIAACRAQCPGDVSRELGGWARLQLVAMLVSIGPVAAAGYLLVTGQGDRQIDPAIVIIVCVTVYVSMWVTFVRMALQSLLAFRWLAGLDTLDSVARSTGWLIVAWVVPTALGLAVVTLLAAITAGLAGGCFLVWLVRRSWDGARPAGEERGPAGMVSLRRRVGESLSFMGLLVATRAFHTLPSILVARVLGFDAAGILGAFLRVVEIFALPFTVIGNALMVRAQEVKQRGATIVCAYWDMLTRFVIVALGGVLAFAFVAHDVARALLPESPRALQLFTLMTPMLFFRATSDLFAPASDYVGGLTSRVFFLMLCAVFQLPLIWGAARLDGEVSAILTIVGWQAVMLCGYVLIARRVFFERSPYRPPKDFLVALAIIAAAAVAGQVAPNHGIGLLVYLAVAAVGFVSAPLLRRQYASGRFMRFELI